MVNGRAQPRERCRTCSCSWDGVAITEPSAVATDARSQPIEFLDTESNATQSLRKIHQTTLKVNRHDSWNLQLHHGLDVCRMPNVFDDFVSFAATSSWNL